MTEDIRYKPTPTKDGVTFKGCCELCMQPIYTGNDHEEDCIYG